MLKAKLLGATAAAEDIDISDYFSTYLYTGNGSTQTITNGIDLAGEGGLVWAKKRSGTDSHVFIDTLRGVGKIISSDTTAAEFTASASITSFNSDGFSLGNYGWVNGGASTYASWTFRKAPRFFDVVTYTGNGTAGRTIAHNLGVVPGCIIVKRTDTTGDWQVYHRSNTAAPETDYLVLNSTAATVDDNTRWNDTLPTSTVFSLGTNANVNASGGTYVAYLFAHDPLGPSGDGSDGLIACGLHTQAVTGANELINLGWEPQWVLTKMANLSDDWILVDNMRGFLATANSTMLRPNLANSDGLTNSPRLASNGFVFNTTAGQQHIYIAIRRGPMREPTSGTEVFHALSRNGTSAVTTISSSNVGPVDLILAKSRNVSNDPRIWDRLRGPNQRLTTNITDQEYSSAGVVLGFDSMTGVRVQDATSEFINTSGVSSPYINYMFRRAPGFFDVVAYTGTGSAGTVPHNLGVAPELMIIKDRTSTNAWSVNAAILGTSGNILNLSTTGAAITSATPYNSTAPTSTVFTVGTAGGTNSSGLNYIAYLFATLPGISKVGSYTGNGSSQTINCGFTGGARFVLIKRTDAADAWYVWDTARGIVSGNDPYFRLNTNLAEVTTTDHIDPDNSGFALSTSFAGTNQSGGSYIFLAIA